MTRATEVLLDWTTSGSGKRDRLEHALREAIRAGRLPAGTRLPSTRTLASDLDVARGTVVEAYAQLVAEGWLEARRGSGTIVAGTALAAVPAPAAPTEGDGPAITWDFRQGIPDLSRFPRSEWLTAQRAVLKQAPDALLGYPDPRGPEEARVALVAYLGRVRGVITDPACVMFTGGFAQGLSLSCAVLAARGARRIVVEDPSGAEVRELVARAGLEPVPVPVDEHGLQTDQLPDDAGAALVTPAHQYPTGAVLAPERRAALLHWAAARHAVVFEDDYDAEFRYDREPVGSLQGRAPALVIHGGSVSKTMAPGLRLGWAVIPPQLTEAVARQRLLTDHGGPVLEQLTFAHMLETGGYERHVRRMRQAYKRRRDLLVAALERHAPQLRVEGIAAGVHLVCRLPAGRDERVAVELARLHGVGVGGAGDPRNPGLVLGYGQVPEAAVEPAVRALAKALTPLGS